MFWETSTAGLITSDISLIGTNQYTGLNDLMDSGVTNGPFSFSNINFTLNENQASGAEATNFFECLDSAGNPCNDNSNVLRLISVVDGFNNERDKQFTLYQNPSILDQFQIKTSSEFIFNHDASVRENYTFFIEATANGQTNTLSFTGSLSNTAPTNLSFPNYNRVEAGVAFFRFSDSILNVTIVSNGEIVNGSNISTRNTEELLYSINLTHSGVDYSSYFNYYTDSDGNVILQYLGGLAASDAAVFNLTIEDADGNGSSIVLPFNIDIT